MFEPTRASDYLRCSPRPPGRLQPRPSALFEKSSMLVSQSAAPLSVRARFLTLLTGIVAIAVMASDARAVTKIWTGGTSTDWSIASNWSPSGAPASGDSVQFPLAGANRTINLAGNRTVADVDVHQQRRLSTHEQSIDDRQRRHRQRAGQPSNRQQRRPRRRGCLEHPQRKAVRVRVGEFHHGQHLRHRQDGRRRAGVFEPGRHEQSQELSAPSWEHRVLRRNVHAHEHVVRRLLGDVHGRGNGDCFPPREGDRNQRGKSCPAIRRRGQLELNHPRRADRGRDLRPALHRRERLERQQPHRHQGGEDPGHRPVRRRLQRQRDRHGLRVRPR